MLYFHITKYFNYLMMNLYRALQGIYSPYIPLVLVKVRELQRGILFKNIIPKMMDAFIVNFT